MSEYQYYEFQTLDRPLTAAEQPEVEAMTSHIDVTSTRAVVTYSYGGGFRHPPREVLAKYFDAFLYLANWGSRTLMFRFPKATLDAAALEPYCLEHYITLKPRGKYLVLEIELDEEDGFGWVEGEGQLSALAHLRNDILAGDYRCLYLAWLKASELIDEDGAAAEPPLPAGLGKLSASLQRFVEFFDIDQHLIKSAAAASPARAETAMSDKTFQQALAGLPRAECDDWLFRLAQGEAGLGQALRRKLQGPPAKTAAGPRRTVRELTKDAQRLQQEEQQRLAEEAEQRRIEALKQLAKREGHAWEAVEALLQRSQAKAYDDATQQLKQLRDLAEFQQTPEKFQHHLRAIVAKYRGRHSFIKRLEQAGLK